MDDKQKMKKISMDIFIHDFTLFYTVSKKHFSNNTMDTSERLKLFELYLIAEKEAREIGV